MSINFFLAALLLLVAAPTTAATPPLERLDLPEGFRIRQFAAVPDARQMVLSPAGVVYVGSRGEGKVVAIKDQDGDGDADQTWLIAEGLDMPSGIAMQDGHLYVGAVSTIYRFKDIDHHLDKPAAPEIVTRALPSDQHHGWKYLNFGPDRMLYVPIGAPCNICLSDDPRYTSILRMNPQDGLATIYATGIRNTVGFAFHPTTKALWFTDNGRDMLGDDVPPEELNVALQAGQHFGYPYVHGRDIRDPEFGKKRPLDLQLTAPALEIQAHSAALGVEFYLGTHFPKRFHRALFIAEHGSWNRSPQAGPVGYQVSVAFTDGSKVTEYEPFITGFLTNGRPWGRPNDILQLNDGSLLISDDAAGALYRVTYRAVPADVAPDTSSED